MLLLNDHLLPTAALPLPNRGLAFGDGFFETLVFAEGRLRYAADHLSRMQQAAQALHLELPAALATEQRLTATLTRLATAAGLSEARLRLQVWRAGGGRYTPTTAAAEWLATAEPFVADSSAIQQADFAQHSHALYSPLSFCKGPQAWLYVRAAHERRQRGLDEIILCDAAGHVAEAGAAAIFWIREGALFTPALQTGCVAGVRRAHLLRAARAQGVPCHEGRYLPSDMLAAEAVFTANVAALRPVLRIGQQALPPVLPPLWHALSGWDQQA
ncbi:branched-chain amino acid aminotransferase [Hymenobacter daecheongensis DSM 21074]|uniref:branched-chain-amino-acid transaminase n=1 Tax=Hymenobacter daecheongensis DSM 21074 TaxID=1121955 RepID=A0A1M6JZW2_9BACT|nr:aminotransferase class IV [Hymenobacter daecheongensis]SHJ52198.1 branched-chain amino acid aminotransferase [Hymenobacter daecheongensis DSM 21074]